MHGIAFKLVGSKEQDFYVVYEDDSSPLGYAVGFEPSQEVLQIIPGGHVVKGDGKVMDTEDTGPVSVVVAPDGTKFLHSDPEMWADGHDHPPVGCLTKDEIKAGYKLLAQIDGNAGYVWRNEDELRKDMEWSYLGKLDK